MPAYLYALWLLLIWAMGWAAFPLAYRIFGDRLPDGGLAVGRILFLGSWSLLAFWLGHAGVPVATSTWLWLPLMLLGAIAGWRNFTELRAFFERQRHLITVTECCFLLTFVVFFMLRGFWSETNGNNGEKAMDSALIGSLTRAQHLPPPNPYAAGTDLQSYYYFGHLETALLTRAVGTSVRWSYNLMCATLPALCMSTLLSLGIALTGRIRRGAGVAGGVLILGTLSPLTQWFIQPMPDAGGRFLRLDFFATSRLIPYSINEFPWFTFNQADLHAHYFDFLFELAMLCLAWAIFNGRRQAVLAAAPVLAAEILTNSWDFPISSMLLGLALLAAPYKSLSRRLLIVPGTWLLSVMAAILMALPYLTRLKTAANLPSPLVQPASPLLQWMLLWGPMLLVWLYFAWLSQFRRSLTAFPIVGLALMAVVYGVIHRWTPVLCLEISALLFSSWMAWKFKDQRRYLALLAICGLCALLWSETTWSGFLGSADHIGTDDYKRQDTVFKFGLQAWFLFGTAAAAGAALTFRRWLFPVKILALAAVNIMLVSSIAVVGGRTEYFRKHEKWDAWAHMSPEEQEAATWLLQNVKPGENIMEAEMAAGGDYTEYFRYTHATGIPTVIGPQAHSFQWAPAHSGDVGKEWEEVTRRKSLARLAFTAGDPKITRAALRGFGVRYIVVGQLERREYGARTMSDLETFIPTVFHAGAGGSEHQVSILDLGTAPTGG